MPQNVRNWWVEPYVTGRKSLNGFGPRSREGVVQLAIYQRDAGSVLKAVKIETFVEGDELTLVVFVRGERVGSVTTKR